MEYKLNLEWDELVALKRAVKCSLIRGGMNNLSDSPMDKVFIKVKEVIKNA